MKAIRFIYNLPIFQANFCPYHTYSFVNNYEILGFVEIKTDYIYEIDLPGCIEKMKNRFKLSRIKSEEQFLHIKKIEDYICHTESDSKYNGVCNRNEIVYHVISNSYLQLYSIEFS